MKRQDEARHRSEEIDIDVFEEALDAIRRRITKVDRSHDIPFIAGSSKDGKTIFIDRHLPPTFTHLLKKIRIEPFIVVHEKVEKALLDELGLHYLHAHQIALRMEREAVFRIKSNYSPAGDQPKAIKGLVDGLKRGERHQTLLGVTGSGKTFTVANVIEAVQKPTLVIAHNKTLAAQLAQEYREFFPDAAVHYFVSYYDYYQPEAYVPHSDTYIEKEAQINEEIERLRHASTQALLTRKRCDCCCLSLLHLWLGSPEEYKKIHLELGAGVKTDRSVLIRDLIRLYFERTTADLTPGTFRALGNSVEIMPTGERLIYRVEFDGDHISQVRIIDAITRAEKEPHSSLFLFPAKHYVTPENERDRAIADIKHELKEQLAEFDRKGKLLEAERLKRRTNHDLALIKEIGYCNGIENYSRHFDGRAAGQPPYTLLDYFPHKADGTPDFLTVIDESHVSVPQIGGMYAGDRARKETLVDFGFRLPQR
jgi:excinuclease ABC subunit B